MSYTKPLYHKDSNGKTRTWWVDVDGSDVVVHHGLLGGKIVTKRTACKGKNQGRANETTPEQQAELEAQSKWNKQVDREDYHWDVLLAGRQLRPMLARTYAKVAHQVDWESGRWWVQPKLDGLRLPYGFRYRDSLTPELLTRKGETHKVPHVADVADDFMMILQELTDKFVRGLDGELYLHGLPLNEISGRAKKYHPELTEELEYHLFDLIIEGMTFEDRYTLLCEAFDIYQRRNPNYKVLRLVETHTCKDEDHMKERHGQYTGQGYEGIMIRDKDSQYHMAQRPNCLYKYKVFEDSEYKIIDVWEDKNGNAMFVCHNPLGANFDLTPKRTHKERKQMILEKDQYIGKWIKVQYQGLTSFGVPEFPVGLEIRNCDENGQPLE